MADPAFVLPTPDVARTTHEGLELYLPTSTEPAPAVLLIHGVPYSAEGRPLPSAWNIYQGYASQLADRGCVAAAVDHSPDGRPDDERSNAALAKAIAAVRAYPRVDGGRLALWFFSGSGPLAAPFLQNPPEWLRCVALTYPVLGDTELVTVRGVHPVEAVKGARGLSVVMTVVGHELADVAPTQPPFIDAARAAGVRLEVIEAPNGRHGFDVLDHTDESRQAVGSALAAVSASVHA
ncbi:alpha/beta hydrolase family protein [Kribbella sp. NPDC051586]|uniref:alpha/beta hydrolase family protein n=1 Tax=Kribbella sp. NPDC051586 TaxID=3364118 RepID=UPI0037B18CC2